MHFARILYALFCHLADICQTLYNFFYSLITVFNCLILNRTALNKRINMHIHFCNYTNCTGYNSNCILKFANKFIDI